MFQFTYSLFICWSVLIWQIKEGYKCIKNWSLFPFPRLALWLILTNRMQHKWCCCSFWDWVLKDLQFLLLDTWNSWDPTAMLQEVQALQRRHTEDQGAPGDNPSQAPSWQPVSLESHMRVPFWMGQLSQAPRLQLQPIAHGAEVLSR